MTEKEIPTHPWERQKGEPTDSYDQFNEFLKLNSNRSLPKLVLHYTNAHQNIDTPTLDALKKKSSKWDWFKRASAYDDYRREKERSELEERAMNRLIERLDENEEEEKAIHKKIMTALKQPDFEKNFSKNAYGVSELSKAKKNATESQRLDLGEPTLIQKTDSNIKVKEEQEKRVSKIEDILVRLKRKEDEQC